MQVQAGIKHPKKKKMTLQRKLFILCMISLQLLTFIGFYVYININSIVMAFQQKTTNGFYWTFGNFERMFREFGSPYSVMSEMVINTLIFFGINMLFMLPVTMILAYLIYKKIFMYKFFRVVFFLPSIISAVVYTMVFRYMLNVHGPIAALLQDLFNLPQPPDVFADSRYALWGIVAYTVWTGFGSNLLLFGGAMARIPYEIIEYGRLDGVGMNRELWQIIVPVIWPTLSTMITLGFVGIFMGGGPILLFTKGEYGTYTISFWLFYEVLNNGNLEYASAVGLFFTLIGVPITLIARKVSDTINSAVEY